MITNCKNVDGKLIKKGLTLMGKPFFRAFLLMGTCLILAAAVLFVYWMNPSKNPFVPVCFFYRLTGLYCPTCGMTRAMYHVLHGNFAQGFSMNVLWPGILLFLGASAGLWFFWLVTNKNPLHRANLVLRKYPAISWFILIVLFGFWIFRNIPVYPFTLLAP